MTISAATPVPVADAAVTPKEDARAHLGNALMILSAIEARMADYAKRLFDEHPSPARSRHDAMATDLASLRRRLTAAHRDLEHCACNDPELDAHALAAEGFRL